MPSTDQRTLIHRIESLERRLQRIRVMGIVAVLAIISMASMQGRVAQEAPLEATEFRLIDENGDLRGIWTTALGDPQLALMSEDWMVSLTPRLVTQGLRGPDRSSFPFDMDVAADSLAAGVRFGGSQGQLRFKSTDGAPSVELLDAAGNVRAVVGRTELTRPRTGSQEITAASSIILLDDDGSVVWRAPM